MSHEAIINEIVNDIETNLDFNNVHESSFHIFLMSLMTKVINVVEMVKKDESGSIKKYIVIKVGEEIVERHFPKYLSYYQENAGILIEIVIESFYMLKESKTIDKLSKWCCLPWLSKK